jgi:hypothetical protein
VSPALECDALATLVVRLEAEAPTSGQLRWHRWHEAHDAGTHSLQGGSRSQDSAHHKQLPAPDRTSYFVPHVQRLLFPPPGSRSERWLCCPTDLSLDIGWDDMRRAKVELLERLSIPLAPSHSIGLIHLSLDADPSQEPTGTLKWASDLRKTFPRVGKPRFVLNGELGERILDSRRPYKALVTELFGDPHDEVERHLYTIFFAKEPVIPPETGDSDQYLAGWRRALASSFSRTEHGIQAEQRNPQNAAAQRASLGAVEVVVLGRSAAFTAPDRILDRSYARSFRSYWSESLVFALLQHDRLEHLAGRLAELGFDPSTDSLDHLYDEWIAFRNMFWWSQLSTTTDIPQTLVKLLRAEDGTERLFSDLESDFATYTARRRWRLEDDQTRALANLQIYGAAVAVIGSLATIAALLHPTHTILVVVVCTVVIAGIAAGLFVRTRLPDRPTNPKRAHDRRDLADGQEKMPG